MGVAFFWVRLVIGEQILITFVSRVVDTQEVSKINGTYPDFIIKS
jgi:hypothetical protein